MEHINTDNIKTLSPETSFFVESLANLLQMEETLLSAFEKLYGEEVGDNIYHESGLSGICESLQDNISKWLGHSVVLSLGDRERVNGNIL